MGGNRGTAIGEKESKINRALLHTESEEEQMVKKLVLFDIDGTLIRIGRSRHGKAFEYAVQEHTGAHISTLSADPFGRTDTGILMNMLSIAGYDREKAATMIPHIYETMIGYYLEHEVDLRSSVFSGALSTVQRLFTSGDYFLGLLTGNHETIGWHKLRKAGIDGYFRLGSFGNEALERNDLVEIALRKISENHALHFSGEEVVIIGDTPRDVECGKTNNTKTIAVATGSFSTGDLSQCGADLVLEDLGAYDEIMKVLLS